MKKIEREGYLTAFVAVLLSYTVLAGFIVRSAVESGSMREAAMDARQMSGPLGAVVLALAAGAAASALLVRRLWTLPPTPPTPVGPAAAAWLMLVPPLSFYWVFPACWGWAKSLSGPAAARGVAVGRLEALGLASAILSCLSGVLLVLLALLAPHLASAENGPLERLAQWEMAVAMAVLWAHLVMQTVFFGRACDVASDYLDRGG